MSEPFDSMAEGLVQEALSEAASTFFGSRRNLEHSIEGFHEYLAALKRRQARVLEKAGRLHAVLLHESGIAAFYEALGVEGKGLDHLKAAREGQHPLPKVSWSLGSEGKYIKIVAALYADLHTELEEYLHGSWKADPNHPKKKILSENAALALVMCETVNKEIERVNTSIKPSQTLSFVRSLNIGEAEKSEAAGGTLPVYNEELDREMRFEKLDCEAVAEEIQLPETPQPKACKAALVNSAKRLYLQEKAAVKDLLSS
jgi:hypothetical protein